MAVQKPTKKMYRSSKWQAKQGCGNHVCYGIDWTCCGGKKTCHGIKKGGMAKINSSESAMKWKWKNLSYSRWLDVLQILVGKNIRGNKKLELRVPIKRQY